MNEIKQQLQELMAVMTMYAENPDSMDVTDFVNDCLDILGDVTEQLDDVGPINEPINTDEYYELYEVKEGETFDVEGNNKIADHYGYFWQRDMLTEECAEVIQAVNKCRRCCVDAQNNFLEELADIKVLLAQMEHFLNEDKITAIANEKIARELKRIEKEKKDEEE